MSLAYPDLGRAGRAFDSALRRAWIHKSMILLVTTAACTACRSRTAEIPPGTFRGAELVPPGPKPDFTLTSTSGRPFHFRAETDGHVTLLFFGYTHCTDVCPVHMANIASVLHQLGPDVADRVRVLFVTTDPDRDTPRTLRDWLAHFDPAFIGLTGTTDAIDRAQRAAGLPPAARVRLDDGSWVIGHAAQVIAYTADNRERVLYPFGTRQGDWAHDLPLLIRVAADTP